MRQEQDLRGQTRDIDESTSSGLSGWLIAAIVVFAAAALLFPFYS